MALLDGDTYARSQTSGQSVPHLINEGFIRHLDPVSPPATEFRALVSSPNKPRTTNDDTRWGCSELVVE